MTYSLDEILIFFWLFLCLKFDFLLDQRNTVCKYIIQRIGAMKWKQRNKFWLILGDDSDDNNNYESMFFYINICINTYYSEILL